MSEEEALTRRERQAELLRKRAEKREKRLGRPLTGEEVALEKLERHKKDALR